MEPLQDRYARMVAEGALAFDAAQAAALPELDRIREGLVAPTGLHWFRRPPAPPKGLYLWGGVGRGKSMLADMFAESTDVPRRRVHFHAFMAEIHAGMHEARARGVEDALAPVAKAVSDSARLLVFDEMQVTDIADAMVVGRLFEALFAAGTVVVATSNSHPDDLYRDGLNRQLFLPFVALIKSAMEVRELGGPLDHRREMLAGQPSYFVPADAAARRAIDGIWEGLAGGEGEPLALEVKGREVTLACFRNGAARARFADLCGIPLGPSDYLAIAAAVRALVLEEIPALDRGRASEARRFVTLIDALYEAGARLVASAAAEPEELCTEGPAAFEFRRTASRLREMQSREWGAAQG